MRIATDKARAHLTSVLDAVEAGDPMAQLYVLEAKPSASAAAKEVTDLALEACGGAAFSRHLTVERNFRDARAASVMAPTTDVLHDFIGKALCGMPLF
jgi:alkylation response protein AidB-like acyl-CoA dehydrogenase